MYTISVLVFIVAASITAQARSSFSDLLYGKVENYFELPIIHYNDFHARYEKTSWNSGACQKDNEESCVGGIARLYTAVMKEMERPNAILLNAGDNFQGTLYYTFYKWNITVEFMNKFPHTAMGLGNHEFDDKIAGVIDYLDGLNCPVLAANIDDTEEPRFQNKIQNKTIVVKGGRRIGIVGYMLSTTNEISSTEKLKFTDEIEAVTRVVKELKDEGVDIIIGLSHSGIDVDRKVAESVADLDVIVGGHSHTLLYTGDPPGGDVAYDDYPMVVTQPSGRQVLVLQAAAYTKYLGNITLFIDEAGEVARWEGSPILLDNTITEDPQILQDLAPWSEAVVELGGAEIGTTAVFLDNTNGACTKGECNIGAFITDAMVDEYVNKSEIGWTFSSIAATNAGGIRTSIDETAAGGVITYSDLVMVQPFQNTFDTVELQGKHIQEALEFQVSKPNQRTMRSVDFSAVNFLQWSGLRVTFDLAQPINKRVQPKVHVLCNECRVPEYEPLDPEKWYRVVMNSFLIDGGDGYTVIRDNYKNRTVGRIDTEVLVDYIKKRSPLTNGLDGRINIIKTDQNSAFSFLPSVVLVAAATIRSLLH